MGGLGEFGALFNPGMRHELEERRAKQMLREEEGTGRKGRLGIDLDSGVAVIPGREAAGRAEADDADWAGGSDRANESDRADGSDRAGRTDGAADPETDATGEDTEARPDPRAHAGADNDTATGDRKGTEAPGDRSGTRSRRGGAGQREDRPATTEARRVAVPSGKARRGTSSNGTPGAPSPAGKARRTRS